ncbi:TatD family hydrolase [Luteolibacter flavescens]|uniref:TatD family hydrolase n=1 Tax=Luteolibacter flavescens TaxID=1859460 RepID=A0ABT3FST4_9BACT|nr:TatD family hydrolase [Luteolibacter flavescens]MCW1886643.1 TatD family hydrolase [Luteolibacter flavescens]
MTAYDSHNHLQRFADPAKIVAEMRDAGVAGCVVNGTGEDDWEAVARLADQFPDFVWPAFGLHPWKAHLASPRWLPLLESYLDRFPDASVGECGLDGWIAAPALEIQRPVFLRQVALARERKLPVTIHALKAWEPLFDAFKDEPPPPRFLLHSFGGSAELVKRLADLGAWFSFSGYFLQPRKVKVVEAFKAVPRDRLLIETDAPDMMPPEEYISHPCDEGNHPANLPSIAAGLAERLEILLEELVAQTAENHRAFFDRSGH